MSVITGSVYREIDRFGCGRSVPRLRLEPPGLLSASESAGTLRSPLTDAAPSGTGRHCAPCSTSMIKYRGFPPESPHHLEPWISDRVHFHHRRWGIRFEFSSISHGNTEITVSATDSAPDPVNDSSTSEAWSMIMSEPPPPRTVSAPSPASMKSPSSLSYRFHRRPSSPMATSSPTLPHSEVMSPATDQRVVSAATNQEIASACPATDGIILGSPPPGGRSRHLR